MNNLKRLVKGKNSVIWLNSVVNIKRNVEILIKCFSVSAPVSDVSAPFADVDIIPKVTPENQYEVLSDVVTPLWLMDYKEQLLNKTVYTKELVSKIKTHNAMKGNTRIHVIIPSPTIESYRNKDEFSIRTGVDGNDKTVGFFIGSPANGEVVCVQPTKLISLKENHIYLSEIFQKLIRDSPLKACHNLNDGGFWKNLIVKSNIKGEIMVIVIGNPTGVSEDDIEKSKMLLRERFLNTEFNITSLYLQLCPHVKCTNDQAPFELLYGDKYLYEYYDDIMIRISPDSFQQINTEAALLLYKAILKFAHADKKTTLLDLCCGTGIISLLASKQVRGCVGIEYSTSAVEDAKFNATYNDITNCNFIAGQIEKKLAGVMSDLELSSSLVAVLNPGRQGVNQSAIRVLRNTTNLRKIVYVSCKADSRITQTNFQRLCSKKFHNSEPFKLTDVQPVDMFPLNHHIEHILVFKR